MHTALAEHLISYIPFLSEMVHDVVAFHHERWDGDGYPWGLRGDEIPLVARIFAVVDAFDAMTSNRPYRSALPLAAALDELERCAGAQFDPRIVAAFRRWHASSRNSVEGRIALRPSRPTGFRTSRP